MNSSGLSIQQPNVRESVRLTEHDNLRSHNEEREQSLGR